MTSRVSSLQVFVVAGTVAATLGCYSRLPELVATHWNAAGEADAFMPRLAGTWLLPGMMLGLSGASMSLAPSVARAKPELERAQPPQGGPGVAVQAAAQARILAKGVGLPVDVARWTSAMMGTALIVLGNSLGKTPRNSLVGIRTPWTLANDEVWYRTHRLGGKASVIAA